MDAETRALKRAGWAEAVKKLLAWNGAVKLRCS